MNTNKLKHIITAAFFIAIAASTMAANNTAGKPKCPAGQIAKFINGQWYCKPLTIQSNQTETRQSSPAKMQKVPIKPKRTAITKPDLSIMHIGLVGGTKNKFAVQVKNSGQANSPAVQLFGINKNAGNAVNASSDVPAIKAGKFEWVYITFNNQAFRPGTRLKFQVDGLNQAIETNENNNTKHFTMTK